MYNNLCKKYKQNPVLHFLFLTLLSLFLVPSPLKAQDTLLITNDVDRYELINYVAILEDKEKKYTLEDVTSPVFEDRFIPNKAPYAYNENLESAYWVRFRVKKVDHNDKSYIFESANLHTVNFKIWVPDGQGGYKLKQTGQGFEFPFREFFHKNFLFEIPTDTGKVHTFYVRVETNNHSGFDYEIRSNRYNTFYTTHEYYFLGMYYGILLIMAIYNLFIYVAVKWKVYLYYVLYVLSGALTSLTEDGLGFQFIWTHMPSLNQPIGYIIAPISLMVFFILYSRNFLELKAKFPKLDKLLIYVVLFYFAYYLLRMTVLPPMFHIHKLYLLPFITVYGISIYCLIKGYRPARLYVTGYTFIFISIILTQLRSNGSIEGNLLTIYSFNYGLVLEVVLLSAALGDRIRIIKKEKDIAQQKIIEKLEENQELQEKVNKELEQKVLERTQELNKMNLELQESNEKLRIMTEKVNEMNAKLDLDNWELNKSVKEATKARLEGKEVSYEEFLKIFPNEHSCMKYLEELKWGEKYQCRKCSNIKYIKGLKPFSRKCTRCGYTESVTAYTLFHGVRFPINKAFYMTYITFKRENKITLDELSQLLDLRRNTCWAFKKKVIASINENKKEHLDKWEEIII
ncbi:MAG TPA: 7TM diverse intracellular signaling domain-containing protein [Cytophagaceae bacterium]